MTDEEFSRYCAEVMGYELMKMNRLLYAPTRDGWDSPEYYEPSTDLNQMAEVFDKLVERGEGIKGNNWVKFSYAIGKSGIAQAMREFIESTKEES